MVEQVTEFNKYYWAFVFLITTCPEIYLTREGRLIYQMVLDSGHCRSFGYVSRKLKIPKLTAARLCKRLEKDTSQIIIIKNGSEKEVLFDNRVIAEGLQIAFSILKK